MSEQKPHSRQQQQLEELSSASVRALANDRHLHYRDRLLYRDEQVIPVRSPHLRVGPGQRSLLALRGISDALALRLRYSDASLHKKNCPEEPVQRLLFEWLEQLRVETLVPAQLPGMTHNLHQQFFSWSRGFHLSGLTGSTLGILLYTVIQMCWSRLNAHPVLDETEDFIEATRAGIGPLIGTALAGLRRTRHDQAAYAAYALALAQAISAAIDTEHDPDATASADADAVSDSVFALLLDFDEEELTQMQAAVTGLSSVFAKTGGSYRVYTTAYDTEVDAASLVRKELLRDYRQTIDTLVAEQGVSRSRLVRLLSVTLAQPTRDGWNYGQEEGYIDGRRLSTLLVSPEERRLFIQERHHPQAHCVVAFLIDCSGSMKEQIKPVATLVDIMTRALEHVGASTEILGYTTGAWNGGRAHRDWMRRGRPAFPGRLNEVAYRVFKSADRTWRRSRSGIAALLKPDLFREGIDGEAVLWAGTRLLARDEPRKILVVISDGCPMDTATKLTNDEFYLDNHLKQVVRTYERSQEIQVLGVGVGLDLSPFYRHSLALDLSEGLKNQMLYDLAGLFRAARPRFR